MFHTFKFNHLAVASMAAAVLISAPLSAMASIGVGLPSNAVHFSSPTPAATIDYINYAGAGLDGNCMACVTATGPLTGSLSGYIGTYNLGISAFGGGQSQATPIAPGSSVYSEQLSFGGSINPTGVFSMASGADNLLLGTFNKFSIYAQPRSNSATFQFDLNNLSSNEISPLPAHLYFIVTGTTTSPVSISTQTFLGSSWTSFNSMSIDWTAKLSSTPYSVSSVPEPGEWALMAFGLGFMGFIAKRHKNGAVD